MGEAAGIKIEADGYRNPAKQPHGITLNVRCMGKVARGRRKVGIDTLIDPAKNNIKVWIGGRRDV